MATFDQEGASLLMAAEKFVSENDELNFPAETVARAALTIANGNMRHAEEMLHSIAVFSCAASLESSRKQVASSQFLIRSSRKLLDRDFLHRYLAACTVDK